MTKLRGGQLEGFYLFTQVLSDNSITFIPARDILWNILSYKLALNNKKDQHDKGI